MGDAAHLGHLHLTVRDLDRSVAFYETVVGLEERERYENFSFLSFGEHHHDLALRALGDVAATPGPNVGLYHSAWEVTSREALRDVYERVRDRDVQVSPVDHGISLALYFDDPDGNGVEVYLDTREGRDEKWRGRSERFDPLAL